MIKIYKVTDGKLTLNLRPAGGGYYAVSCPDDPQLLTQAKTLEEAFEMAYDAQQPLNEVRRELKKSVPQFARVEKAAPRQHGKPKQSPLAGQMKLNLPKASGGSGQKASSDVKTKKPPARPLPPNKPCGNPVRKSNPVTCRRTHEAQNLGEAPEEIRLQARPRGRQT